MYNPNIFSLAKEQEFDDYLETEEDLFIRTLELEISSLSETENSSSNIEKKQEDLQKLECEIVEVQQQLQDLYNTQSLSNMQREIISVKAYETKVIETLLMEKINMMEMKYTDLLEDVRSLDMDTERLETQLRRLSQLTCVNEMFHIWFEGPYGTINSFRIGYLRANDEKLIAQTDAGLGQAAMVIDTIASCSKYRFQQYQILPLGSTAKISKIDDRSSIYPLHIDQGPFTMFPRRNFNAALTGFMTCINELGEFVAAYDPTMTMPFRISTSESKIGEVSYTYGDDVETWTRAMKFMLTNIKWIVAWFTKHSRNMAITE